MPRFPDKRATALQFATNNPVLEENQRGIETDSESYKIGDGFTAWKSLPYQVNDYA